MCIGVKGQIWIEYYVDGIFIWNIVLVWVDLQLFFEVYGVEVIYLFLFLVFIFQLFDFMCEFGVQQWMLFQLGNDCFYIGFSIEQVDYVGIFLQVGFFG